jgi:hypothetical protein
MNARLEFLRVLAVVLITFTHTRNELTSGILYFVIEELPTYGTLLLSLISGYLFWNVTRFQDNWLGKKIKSLAIPFLIANVAVAIPVYILHFLGIDMLNRLTYDYTLLTEGVFSLSQISVNPPTYFIRDLFVWFALLSLFFQRDLRALWFILPLILFGKLIIRIDIIGLFLIGMALAHLQKKTSPAFWWTAAASIGFVAFFTPLNYTKYLVAILFLMTFLKIPFPEKFPSVGGYTYLLHLYHSPIMIVAAVVLTKTQTSEEVFIFGQIIISMLLVWGLYALSRRLPKLKILSGGR